MDQERRRNTPSTRPRTRHQELGGHCRTTPGTQRVDLSTSVEQGAQTRSHQGSVDRTRRSKAVAVDCATRCAQVVRHGEQFAGTIGQAVSRALAQPLESQHYQAVVECDGGSYHIEVSRQFGQQVGRNEQVLAGTVRTLLLYYCRRALSYDCSIRLRNKRYDCSYLFFTYSLS